MGARYSHPGEKLLGSRREGEAKTIALKRIKRELANSVHTKLCKCQPLGWFVRKVN